MKRNRMMTVLVAFVLLLSCFTVVYADTTEATYTEEEVLGGAALATTLDFTQITSETLTDYGTIAYDGSGVAIGAEGLVVTEDGTQNDFRFQPTVFENRLGDAGALKVTFKLTGDAQMNMDIQNSVAQQRIRFFTYNNRIGYNGKAATDNAVTTGYAGDSLETGVWHTYIVKMNAGTVAYYKLNASGTYDKIVEYTPNTATTDRFYVGIGGASDSGSVTYQSVAQYRDSLTTILGSNAAVLHSYDFEANYDGTTNGAVMGTTAVGNDGLILDEGTDVWKMEQGNVIPDGGAAVVRAKVTTGSQFWAYFGNGTYRAVLGVESGALKFRDSSTNTVTLNNLHDIWNTFIIKDNGNGYSVWRTTDESKGYGPAQIVCTTKNTGGLKGINLQGAGSMTASTYVDYVKIYTAGATDVPEDENMTLLHDGDFSAERNILADAQVQSTTATLNNGVLDMSGSEKTYFYYDAGIPAGGYAEISFKPEAQMSISFKQDGVEMPIICGLLNGTTKASSGSWVATATNLMHATNKKHIYRIGRSADGNTYNIWHQLEGDTGWIKVFTDESGRTTADTNKLGLTGTGIVDYIKVYAPKQNGVVFTDGKNTTSIVTKAQKMEYPAEMRVIANTTEAGVMIIGSYIGTSLDKAILEPVAANVEKQVVADVSAAERARVFVWNNLEDMEPLASTAFEVTIGK